MTTIKISDLSEAVARLEDAEKMGAELLHFNGGQWFVKSNDETVSVSVSYTHLRAHET